MRDRELARAVGKMISEKRRTLKLSQEDLAEQVGINQESLSKMEKGIIAPKFERLQLFADALRCRVEDLFRFCPGQPDEQAAAISELICGLPDEKRELIVKIVAEIAQALEVPRNKA
jgi:transcriptional regulator with XRE-family HTH domain